MGIRQHAAARCNSKEARNVLADVERRLLGGKQTLGELPENDAHDPEQTNAVLPARNQLDGHPSLAAPQAPPARVTRGSEQEVQHALEVKYAS